MTEATPRRNVGLIVSICLNVILIAMIAVGIARAWERQREMMLGHAFSANSIVAHLPPDRAAAVQKIVDAHSYKLGLLSDDAERSRLDARPIFTAQRFDAAAYAKAQERMLKTDQAFEAERMKQMAEIAAVLTSAERQSIADRARREPHRPHPHPGL
jgi:uncharacterized membrane protein